MAPQLIEEIAGEVDMGIRDAIRDIFGTPGFKVVRLLGYVGERPGISQVASTLVGFQALHAQKPLSAYAADEECTVKLIVIAQGDTNGFCYANSGNGGNPSQLPAYWWDGVTDSIYMFAFCCHSAKYVKQDPCGSRIRFCLGYEEEVAFWFGSDWAITEWRYFISEVMALLNDTKPLDERSYYTLKQRYNRELLRLANENYGACRRAGCYALMLSLEGQDNNIRLLRRGAPCLPLQTS